MSIYFDLAPGLRYKFLASGRVVVKRAGLKIGEYADAAEAATALGTTIPWSEVPDDVWEEAVGPEQPESLPTDLELDAESTSRSSARLVRCGTYFQVLDAAGYPLAQGSEELCRRALEGCQ